MRTEWIVGSLLVWLGFILGWAFGHLHAHWPRRDEP